MLYLGYITILLKFALWELLPVLPMMALFHFIMVRKDKKGNVKTAARHILAVYLFCLAVLAVLSITSVPDVFRLSFEPTINLAPFSDFPEGLLHDLSNILLFLPVGFLLPMLWKKFDKWQTALLCGFFFSLSIEVSQLFNSRITDIDDLLLNTAGAIIGYFIFKFVKKRAPGISAFAIGHANHWKWEPYACFCFAWITLLFFHHFISGWLITGAPAIQ
ncbi:MAG: VanZ family protein [Clostridiales bacterium]|nr:VanZ family protein [Clostridiales bacterium]